MKVGEIWHLKTNREDLCKITKIQNHDTIYANRLDSKHGSSGVWDREIFLEYWDKDWNYEKRRDLD